MEQGYSVITGKDAINMAVKGTYLVRFDKDNLNVYPFEVIGMDANGLHCLETDSNFQDLDYFSCKAYMDGINHSEKRSTWLRPDICNRDNPNDYRLLKPACCNYNECWHPSIKRGAHVFLVTESVKGYTPATCIIDDILSYKIEVYAGRVDNIQTLNILDYNKTWFTDYAMCMSKCNRLEREKKTAAALDY